MENDKKRRIRKVSAWMSDAVRSIDHEEEILAGKKIVLKILRYMEKNNMTQKELAEKLGVSPQYINKFLHGQECDIKVSTAVRYGKILDLKLIEIPEPAEQKRVNHTVIYTITRYMEPTYKKGQFIYNQVTEQPYRYN